MSTVQNHSRLRLRKIFRGFFYFFLALFIIGNLLILLSGRTYLYKGIRYTYLMGRTGPGIYDLTIFPYKTIQAGKKASGWPKHQLKQTLSPGEQQFMKKLDTKAFLVFRGDTLIYEQYFGDHAINTVSNSFSAAKTIVGLLIGIAVDEGKIKSLDEPVGNYIPAFRASDKKAITIRHLLMMASGLDWEESGSNPFSENAESYYGTDLYGLVCRQKGIEKPGKKFHYQSGNSQLLGFILEKATGKSVSNYTQEKLWIPIGCEHDAYWSLDKTNGNEKSFCCVYATARDFARLGKLILHFGKWGNQQVIPEWYMREMVSNPKLSTKEGIPNTRYGLHIWTYRDQQGKINYCRGIKGQYIMALPDENLIIVRLGSKRNDNFVIPEEKKSDTDYVKNHIQQVGHPSDVFEYLRIGRKFAKGTYR